VSVRAEVLLWAKRIIAKGNTAAPHELLELKRDAGIDEAQEAFHKIARKAHPDLHRASLTPDELEQITLAYARVAGAYQDFRSQRVATRAMKPMGAAPAASSEPKQAGAAGEMSSKALVYYRKAELALRRGDLRGAVLQLKMAIAADPQSQFLKRALTEVESEVGKKP
jgi:hypothetical protein